MNDIYWIVVLLPIAWLLAAKVIFHTSLNWLELGASVLVAGALTMGLWQAGLSSKTTDTEIWNGEVTSKVKDTVSCGHSYRCNCRSTTDSKGKSSETCDTCHEHIFDYDWVVQSNVGSLKIPRIDRQGRNEPPRWSAVRIGEPFSRTNSYTNWVKGSEMSLMNLKGASDSGAALSGMRIPVYPDQVHDFYRVNRIVGTGPLESIGLDAAALAAWNRDLSDRLRAIGPKKQGNVVIVLAVGPEAVAGPAYADTLERAWLGGRKNDTVVVIGVEGTPGASAENGETTGGMDAQASEAPRILWAKGFGWSRDEMLYVELRDKLGAMGRLDRDSVLDIVEQNVLEHFVRIPMTEFEYLRNEIEPPLWAVILAGLVGIAAAIGLTAFFHQNELTLEGLNKGGSGYRRRWSGGSR